MAQLSCCGMMSGASSFDSSQYYDMVGTSSSGSSSFVGQEDTQSDPGVDLDCIKGSSSLCFIELEAFCVRCRCICVREAVQHDSVTVQWVEATDSSSRALAMWLELSHTHNASRTVLESNTYIHSSMCADDMRNNSESLKGSCDVYQ